MYIHNINFTILIQLGLCFLEQMLSLHYIMISHHLSSNYTYLSTTEIQCLGMLTLLFSNIFVSDVY